MGHAGEVAKARARIDRSSRPVLTVMLFVLVIPGVFALVLGALLAHDAQVQRQRDAMREHRVRLDRENEARRHLPDAEYQAWWRSLSDADRAYLTRDDFR